jgi:hypothetical protein
MKDRFVTFPKIKEDDWLRIYNQSRKEGITIPTLLMKVVMAYLQEKKENRPLNLKRFDIGRYKRIGARLQKTGENVPLNNDYTMLDRISEIIEKWIYPNEETEEQVKDEPKDELRYIRELFGK